MAGYTIAELPMEEISMGRSRAERAAIDSAVQSGKRPPGMAKKPGTPALDRISARIQAPKPAPVSKLGIAARAGGAMAAGGAIASGMEDDSTARYAKRFGVSEPTGSGSIGDISKFTALRAGGFASDLANNLTMGAAGNLYRDKPDGMLQLSQPSNTPPQGIATVPQQEAAKTDGIGSMGMQKQNTNVGDRTTVPGALDGSVYDEGNADISATSTRKDGKLNSFTGIGDPARPNWEQRNPADYQAAVQRGEKDKAAVVSMAANYAAQGDREGAARMAAGDPAAAAAAEQAFQQRELRIAALRGNKGAAAMLNSMGDNETERLRIASNLVPKPETAYDQERTRGAKMDNDRAAITDGLLNQYMSAPDDKTRNTALSQWNALNGKNKVAEPLSQKDALDSYLKAMEFEEERIPFSQWKQQMGLDGAAGGQTATKEQVDAAAKAKGITDPAQLKELYATYGVQ